MIFLSHCILNENTRYLGGACRPGAVREIIEPCIDCGLGIVQLPCPEQHAWGGVDKRFLLYFFGAKHSLFFSLRRLLLPVMLAYTRLVYIRLARKAAKQMKDYLRRGYLIRGIVGIDGSPSCGVRRILDVDRALTCLGDLDVERSTTQDVNAIVLGSVTKGRGLFIECLVKELNRRGLSVPLMSHSLIDELTGFVAPLSL